MKFEEYAARNIQLTQEAPEAQKAQEVWPVEAIAAKLQAEKLSTLIADTQEALDAGKPPAHILQGVIAGIYGEESTQAAQATELINKQRHPGGYEISLAGIRQNKALLRKQRKALEERIAAIDEEIKRLDAEEKELTSDSAIAAKLDAGLTEVIAFCKQLDAEPQPDIIRQLKAIYEQQKSNRAAMGLLYGYLHQLSRKQFEAVYLDIMQQQEFKTITAQIAEAITGE